MGGKERPLEAENEQNCCLVSSVICHHLSVALHLLVNLSDSDILTGDVERKIDKFFGWQSSQILQNHHKGKSTVTFVRKPRLPSQVKPPSKRTGDKKRQ